MSQQPNVGRRGTTPVAIEVQVDDLAFVTADAIAWPVSATLRATTPLLRRLEAAGGERMASQLQPREALAIGSAVVTGAGDLGVELLVSAVVASDSEAVSATGVRRAIASAMHRAHAWQIARLALTPFGLGAGNLDIEQSAEIMTDVITHHGAGAEYPREVVIVVETDDEADAFRRRLEHR